MATKASSSAQTHHLRPPTPLPLARFRSAVSDTERNSLSPSTIQHFSTSGADDDTTKQAKSSGSARAHLDLVDDFFLSSEKPTIALFAISICLVGVMDLLPRQRHDPDIWIDKLDSVSGFYGPGVTISWCISGMSMLYDANQDFRMNGFHYLKYLALAVTGAIAVGDAVKRALRSDFGPSYAAALYMSDKSFELATLLYTVYHFPVRRNGNAGLTAHPSLPEVERSSNSLKAQAAAAIERYKIWPCVAMVSIWVWSRALGNQHIVYNIHAQNPNGVNIGWNPILSSQYWKLAVPIVCFSLTSCLSLLTRWGLWTWGVPAGILSSFATLHSGFFGTFTPLKLTSCSLLDLDQITALVATIAILVLQYATEISFVVMMWQRLCDRFLGVLGKPRR